MWRTALSSSKMKSKESSSPNLNSSSSAKDTINPNARYENLWKESKCLCIYSKQNFVLLMGSYGRTTFKKLYSFLELHIKHSSVTSKAHHECTVLYFPYGRQSRYTHTLFNGILILSRAQNKTVFTFLTYSSHLSNKSSRIINGTFARTTSTFP